ncbi:MAG: glycosyltransferase family 4 protein [Candidatus Bathyarchaeia archaeon]
MLNIVFIGRNIHFLSSASGSAVLPREIIKCVYKDLNVSIVTIDDKLTELRKLHEKTYDWFNDVVSKINIFSISEDEAFTKRIKSIYTLLKNGEFDIIHIFDSLPVHYLPFIHKITRFCGSKVIFNLTMPTPKSVSITRSVLLKRYTNGMIASSPYLLHDYLINSNMISQIVPPPVDLSVYKFSNINRETIPDKFSILYIGPLDFRRFPLKVIPLVASMAKCVNLRIVLAPRFENDLHRIRTLLKIIRRNNFKGNVEITYGRVSHESKILLYRSADAVIFPFLKSYRGAVDPPLTLLESLACNGLVLATDVLGIPWIIKDNYNGFLSASIEQLFSKIKYLSENKNNNNIKKIRLNALNTVKEKFSPSLVRNKLLAFYTEMLKY